MCEDQLSQFQAQKSDPVDMEISALSPATTPGDSEAFGLENLAQEKPQLQIPSLITLYGLWFFVVVVLLLLLFFFVCSSLFPEVMAPSPLGNWAPRKNNAGSLGSSGGCCPHPCKQKSGTQLFKRTDMIG